MSVGHTHLSASLRAMTEDLPPFVRITGMVVDFDAGDYVVVLDDAPAHQDEQAIETEADFDIYALAHKLRDFQKRGGTEGQFRDFLAEEWPHYAGVAFPDRKSWLYREEAAGLVELGVAEWASMGSIEEALEAWGLA
jgi:hypothetical protein